MRKQRGWWKGQLVLRSGFAALGFLVVPALGQAQPEGVRPRMQAGIFYGNNLSTLSSVNASFLTVGDPSHAERRRAQNGGIFVTLPFTRRYAVQAEFHYEERGVTIVRDGDTSGTALAVRMNYLEVPLLLRTDFGSQSARVHPVVMAGASGALRMNCEFEARNHARKILQSCNANSSDDNPASNDFFKQYDARLIAAAGIVVNGRGEMYTLQIRYTGGLTDLSNSSAMPSFKPRSQSVTLLIGVTK